MTVKVEGLERLRRQLKALPVEIRAEVQSALERSGEEMVATAKALAPIHDGDLRDSITMTTAGGSTPLHSSGGRQKVGDLKVMVTAGNYGVRYARMVEYGTRRMAARPFFWPSFRILRRRIRGRTTRAIRAAITTALR